MTPPLTRLRERKLAQWGLAFAAAGWAGLQVLGFLVDYFGWSPQFVRIATVVAAGGLAVTLVLAWYHGERGRQRVTGTEAALLGAVLFLTGSGLVLVARMHAGQEPPVARARGERVLDARRVAVLPFRNASPGDEESAMLALGIHDDLLTRIARIRALRIVSRTSVEEYRETTKPIERIAAELGAGAVLQGSVQRAGARVRINVQLIDGAADEHLWAESFDRAWSLENLFAIQAEIAEYVAEALSAALSPEESASIAERPTTDEEAYRLYVRAADLFSRSNEVETTRQVLAMLEEAVARDPQFARGWALLGHRHVWMHWIREDHTPARLALARRAIDRAAELAPDAPATRIAEGAYRYWGFLDYDRAVEQFQAVLADAPDHAEALGALAAVRRRQGQVPEALALFRRAAAGDPRNVLLYAEIAATAAQLGRFEEGYAALEHARALSPSVVTRGGAATIAYAAGDLATMQRALEQAAAVDPRALPAYRVDLHRARGDYDAALALLRGTERPSQMVFSIDLFVVDEAAGDIFRLMGQTDSARARYRAAVAWLEQRVTQAPEDEIAWSRLGLAYAGLGRKQDAIHAAHRATALVPIARETWNGALRARQLAAVYARVGEPDRALDILDDLLQRPVRLVVAPGMLRIDPEWRPLREHPRFHALTQLPAEVP